MQPPFCPFCPRWWCRGHENRNCSLSENLLAHMHDPAWDGMIRFGRNSIAFQKFFTKEVDYHRPPFQIIFYSDLRHQEQGRSSQVGWPWVRSISISLVTMSCIQRLSWVVMHYNSWCIACSHHLLFLLLLRLILYDVASSYFSRCIVILFMLHCHTSYIP